MEAHHHHHDSLSTLLQRRSLVKLLAGTGIAALLGCSSDSSASPGTASGTDPPSTDTASTNASATSTGATATESVTAPTDLASCEAIPAEMGGPFPGDGTNGPNLLTESGVVRSDIRTSIGSASGTAAGVPLTLRLTIIAANADSAAGCAPRAGAGVHVWHATADGYSMYSDGVSDENFLRGVQESAADGTVTFETIHTGCYDGHWPHIHFEVFSDLASATNGGNAIATSQLAFPRETCEVVYAAEGYESSVGNLERVSLESDNVFGDDGTGQQLATMSGDNATGWTARLTVAV